MKKGVIISLTIGILILAFLLFLIYPRITGDSINYSSIESDKFACVDTDGGKEFNVKGIISQGDVVKGTDYCTTETRLKEYYCLTETSTNHYYYNCEYKCVDGACVKEEKIGEEIGEKVEEEKINEEIVDKNSEEGELSELNFFQKIIGNIKGLFSKS